MTLYNYMIDYVIIWCYLVLVRVISCYFMDYVIIWCYLVLVRVISCYLMDYVMYLVLFDGLCNYLVLFGVTCYTHTGTHIGRLRTLKDIDGPTMMRSH